MSLVLADLVWCDCLLPILLFLNLSSLMALASTNHYFQSYITSNKQLWVFVARHRNYPFLQPSYLTVRGWHTFLAQAMVFKTVVQGCQISTIHQPLQFHSFFRPKKVKISFHGIELSKSLRRAVPAHYWNAQKFTVCLPWTHIRCWFYTAEKTLVFHVNSILQPFLIYFTLPRWSDINNLYCVTMVYTQLAKQVKNKVTFY